MSLIAQLELRAGEDSAVRAVLRKSLAFPAGTHVMAFPYVEPFLPRDAKGWVRESRYLVAGLWALHWRPDRRGVTVSLPVACALHQRLKESTSLERRFLNLLDADREALPHHLRQVITLLKDHPIDFEKLMGGVLHWNSERRWVQRSWAQEFYRTLAGESAESIAKEASA